MIYKITLPNTKYGKLTPPEDAFLMDKKIFCVADGITRDPIAPKDFRGESAEELLKNYPRPSGAKIAADLFCKEFVKTLKQGNLVKQAFIAGNNAIAGLNKKNLKKVDYLVNDFWACVACGGVIKNNILCWGAITDCGVAVFDKKGKIRFQTPVYMTEFANYEKTYLRKPDFNWALPEYRKMIRQEFRNRPDKIFKGKCVSYGALTGEKAAEKFMHFGEIKLERGDLVTFYSDGFYPMINHKDFFNKINHHANDVIDKNLIPFSQKLAKEDYKKYGKEKTLVAFFYK